MTTFKHLGLNSELMKSLEDLGFVNPSPIQEKAIPFILKTKNDLIALAQTGTGKTAAFSLPILNQIKADGKDLQAIVLCPTRELCLQISEDIRKFARHSRGVEITAVYGGERIDFQIKSLKRGTNIVVGTPGRVHDLIRRKVLKLQSIKWLVLDEADEMLDMGFKDDLDAILKETPKTRQTLLFSATISKSVHSIAKNYMTNAEEISIGEKNVGAEKVTHEYYIVGGRDRFEALQRILDSLPGVYGILFCRTRHETQEVADKLKLAHYDTDALHGDISQNIRTKIMDRFRRKQVRLLVATDVAARGIDVSDLTHVINYNLPDQNEAYTHRSGRTGRAQKSGIAISLVTPKDAGRIKELERIIGKKFELKKVPNGNDIFEKQIDNFVKEIEEAEYKETGNEKYYQEFAEKLKKTNKEELIKHIFAYKFGHFADSFKNTRDLNTSAEASSFKRDNKNHVNLEINIGKMHGFEVKGLFALINSNKKLKGMEIGSISLMNDSTIFSTDKEAANEVIKNLKGTKFRGVKLDIKKNDKQVEGYQKKRRGGFDRGAGGGRKNFSRGRKKY